MTMEKYYVTEIKTLSLPPLFYKEFKDLKDLPIGIETIIFTENSETYSDFNLPVDNLPSSLKIIKFGTWFNKPVDKLPPNLTVLIFGCLFNRPVDNLPNNIKHLEFASQFNKPVNNLPPNLTHLKFGWCFNHPVDKLPSTLTHLIFGNNFNHPVDILPPNLTIITFGNEFNHPVDNLPSTLIHLTFGKKFNHQLDNLPKNIEELGFTHDSVIKNYIPVYIANIEIRFEYYRCNETIENLPTHIKQIKISDKLYLHHLKKIPFGCKIIDWNDNEIFI